MSEVQKNPESSRFWDTAERLNKITAVLGATATVVSAVVIQSPELTTLFAFGTAADIATGGLIKAWRNRKATKQAQLAAT